HFGYNLKVTDMQAAVGCAQLEKFPSFIKKRRQNWQHLSDGLACVADKLILPQAEKNSQPSWFGFLITLRPEAKMDRETLVREIEGKGIQTRNLFAGNLIKHP
ncbi:MAG: DegT/DnrJ/EryC1/StrS family aminotransferase, partial [Christensenellaceae bacterium]